MNIEKYKENDTAKICLFGRLDSTTSPDLERTINSVLNYAKELILDFNNLEYISSAGLRVVLKAQKAMNSQGSMKIVGVNESIMSIFDATGYSNIITIEK